MPVVDKSFRLPAPKKVGNEYVWHPIVRVGYIVPWGYKQDPNDKDILLPIQEELELLEQAKEYLKKYSLRDVANWLSETTGRRISHVGLDRRIKNEQKRQSEASVQRHLAKRYKEALKKAEKLEKEYAGAKTLRDPEGSSGSEA